MILPLRRFSETSEISVLVELAGRRAARADLEALTDRVAVKTLAMSCANPLAALAGGPQEPAGEHGEHQHEDHAECRCAVVVARAAPRERVLVDEHHHGLGIVADAATAVGQHE